MPNLLKKKNLNLFHFTFILMGGILMLFIIAPVAGMILRPSLSSIVETVSDSEVRESIWLTLWTAMAATILFAIPAIPLAYIIARKEFRFKKLLIGLIDIPIIIPHSAAGIALLGIVANDTIIGSIAGALGIRFTGNSTGIILAMAFVSIPFLINASINGFLSVPERLEKVALNLGASHTRVFFTITLPLAWRSILSGMILMWGRGMSEFGAVIILAYNPMTAPVLIFERFTTYGLKYSTPVAVIFIVISLLVFLLLRLVKRKK